LVQAVKRPECSSLLESSAREKSSDQIEKDLSEKEDELKKIVEPISTIAKTAMDKATKEYDKKENACKKIVDNKKKTDCLNNALNTKTRAFKKALKNKEDALSKNPKYKSVKDTIDISRDLNRASIAQEGLDTALKDVKKAEDVVKRFDDIEEKGGNVDQNKLERAMISLELEKAYQNDLIAQRDLIYARAGRKECCNDWGAESTECKNATKYESEKLDYRKKTMNEVFLANTKKVETESFNLSSVAFEFVTKDQKAGEATYKTGGLKVLVVKLIRFAIITAGIIAVLGIVVGGIMIMVASGDETILGEGKNTIFYSVIGLIIVLLSYIIVTTVQSAVLGLGGG